MFANACSQSLTKAGLLLATLTLCACAGHKGQTYDLPELSGWPDRQATLSRLNEWAFDGRIGVKSADDGFNGKIRWRQDDRRFEASVSGPLGVGTVQLTGNGRSVTLTDKDGISTRLQDAEKELFLRYGWTIPVTSLRFWALGIPDPDMPADTELNESGQLATLSQGGWNVKIGRYRDGGGQPMPARITVTNEATRVRLVIDRWLFFDQL